MKADHADPADSGVALSVSNKSLMAVSVGATVRPTRRGSPQSIGTTTADPPRMACRDD
jgi:hypothetical protein